MCYNCSDSAITSKLRFEDLYGTCKCDKQGLKEYVQVIREQAKECDKSFIDYLICSDKVVIDWAITADGYCSKAAYNINGEVIPKKSKLFQRRNGEYRHKIKFTRFHDGKEIKEFIVI